MRLGKHLQVNRFDGAEMSEELYVDVTAGAQLPKAIYS